MTALQLAEYLTTDSSSETSVRELVETVISEAGGTDSPDELEQKSNIVLQMLLAFTAS